MAVSNFECIQSMKVSSKAHLFFSVNGCSRDNHKKRNCLVFASAKKSDYNPVLQSKVILMFYAFSFSLCFLLSIRR